MKCPTCIEQGKTSRVYPGMSAVTAMGWQSYYDEDGQYHSHDPNWTTTGYRCSEGHNWQTTSQRPCPNCLYGREEGETKMPRDSEGKMYDQCKARYQHDINTVYCVKREGHDGDHEDARGNWNSATEKASPDPVPAGEDGGRDGDIGGGDSS